ncbi:hypothetical protein BGZ68_007676 [Mortierella alpina]|nr:hypothetical protein BGZ68_007676 [Mortierella alpina]
MTNISDIYDELLASKEGDILVKLKDGNELKVISFILKKRSSVFKTMLESSMQESVTGVIDLSSQYSLEAFREFMAYIYYNKRYTGSYVPLLFEVLCISDFYDVNDYSMYIEDRIIELVTDVPMCLMIATEAREHKALAEDIYSRCLEFLSEALKPRKAPCYDSPVSLPFLALQFPLTLTINMPQQPTAQSNKQAQQGSAQNSGGTKMTSEAASRVQSAADRKPGSDTATSGFKERAQSSAAKNTTGGNKSRS